MKPLPAAPLDVEPETARGARFLERHYRTLSVGILLLACFNMTFRLAHESVGEWDESLYATSAWEMIRSGNLVGTTTEGALDYSNVKPPLNVWILAACFQMFGVSLVSLRLPSVLFGLLTVWVLQRWTRLAFGPEVSLFSSLVLATAFGFLHQHSARSGNPDALLTLLILLVVVVLWSAGARPWRRVWLGPLLAGVFLLKGPAVLQPLLLVVLVEVGARRGAAPRLAPLAVALMAVVLPVAAWGVARWQVDGWRFMEQMVTRDLFALSLTPLDGLGGGSLYYVHILHRYHYEWLAAGLVVACAAWRDWPHWIRQGTARLAAREPLMVLLAAWAVATVVVPTVMQTKVIWYLNPFYPLFALIVGLILARGLVVERPRARGRAAMVTVLVGLALVSAESKSLWRLYRVTNLDASVQGLLLAHTTHGGDRRVFRDSHVRSEAFVVRALRQARFDVVDVTGTRPPDARPGDLLVTRGDSSLEGLRLLGRADGHSVYAVE